MVSFDASKFNASENKDVDNLNNYLAEFSYVNGFTPSQDDVVAFKKFKSAPTNKHPHAARWYRHISSFDSSEQSTWPGQQGATTTSADKREEDDDFDLFGSDDDEKESEEQQRIREERLTAYAAKKAKKPGPIAKSSVILDVKPWDDETDLKELEAKVRTISLDGLLWGASKLIPIGYGIQKLQIISTIEVKHYG